MSKLSTINDCKPCKRTLPVTARGKSAGWLTVLLLALLPKCPFCMLAFTSTAILCGKDHTTFSSHTYASPETFYFSLFFSAVILLSIALNKRDARTGYAFLLAAGGCACSLLSVIRGGGAFLYYTGMAMIVSGVWLNGSLLSFLRKLKT